MQSSLSKQPKDSNVGPLFQAPADSWSAASERHPRLKTLACDLVIGGRKALSRVRHEAAAICRNDPEALRAAEDRYLGIITGRPFHVPGLERAKW